MITSQSGVRLIVNSRSFIRGRNFPPHTFAPLDVGVESDGAGNYSVYVLWRLADGTEWFYFSGHWTNQQAVDAELRLLKAQPYPNFPFSGGRYYNPFVRTACYSKE